MLNTSEGEWSHSFWPHFLSWRSLARSRFYFGICSFLRLVVINPIVIHSTILFLSFIRNSEYLSNYFCAAGKWRFFFNIRELNIWIVTLLRNELNKNADNNEDNYPSLEVKSVIRRWSVPLHAVIPRIGAGCVIAIAPAPAAVVSVGSGCRCSTVTDSSSHVFDEVVMLYSTSYNKTTNKSKVDQRQRFFVLFWFYWQVCVEHAPTGNLPAARQGTHIPGLKNFSFFFLFHLLLLNDWLPSILLADWISSQSKGCRCSLHIQSNCFCVR